MDRGDWQSTVHGVVESWTLLSDQAHVMLDDWIFNEIIATYYLQRKENNNVLAPIKTAESKDPGAYLFPQIHQKYIYM